MKHDRDEHFKDANLLNAMFALGGLFVLLLYLYPGDPLRRPRLFHHDTLGRRIVTGRRPMPGIDP